MKAVPIPANEKDRLNALESYELLDSEAEKSFDDLTSLASFICGTPISLITLLDANRQWFKSSVGTTVKESPRDLAFCAYAILEDKIFVVKDTLHDHRFADNILVTNDPKIRFYAGAPLIDKKGFKLGTLCVLDTVPRELNPQQLKALEQLSAVVVAQIQLRFEMKNQVKNDFKLMQAAKMSSLGEMAAGVAHEINNPLTIIQGNAVVLKRLASSEQMDVEKMISGLNKIQDTSNRISKIIKGLLTFARKSDKESTEVVQLDKVIDDTLVLLGERFKYNNVKFIFNQSPDLIIECSPVQLSEVILNLLNNAHDAVVGSANAWVELRIEVADTHVKISVIDSGKGIREEILEHMMEPFFTTKELGKGTGLGLSISKGLIESHGGQLYYDRSSSNTCFVVTLPKTHAHLVKKRA